MLYPSWNLGISVSVDVLCFIIATEENICSIVKCLVINVLVNILGLV